MNRPLEVLMVEDSQVMADMVLMTVPSQDKKITMRHVKSLTEAVRFLAEGNRANVILLDLVLPDAQDVEAVVKLQELYPDIPVVVMSALGEKVEDAVMKAGAQEYLRKETMSLKDLTTIMRHAVIRQEVARKYAPVRESLDETKKALDDASRIEQAVQRRTGAS